jgi:hypothetical protein
VLHEAATVVKRGSLTHVSEPLLELLQLTEPKAHQHKPRQVRYLVKRGPEQMD